MGLRVSPAELARWQRDGLVPPSGRPPGPAARTLPGVPQAPWRVTLALPGVRVVSRANAREHWTTRHRRDRAEADTVRAAWHAAGLARWQPPLPLTVTLTRLGARRMDDDNLTGAFKAIRDALALMLGVDDGDPRVRFATRQLPAPSPGVRVRLTPRR